MQKNLDSRNRPLHLLAIDFDNDAKITMKKRVFFVANRAWDSQMCKRMKLDPYFISYKLIQKYIIELDISHS